MRGKDRGREKRGGERKKRDGEEEEKAGRKGACSMGSGGGG